MGCKTSIIYSHVQSHKLGDNSLARVHSMTTVITKTNLANGIAH